MKYYDQLSVQRDKTKEGLLIIRLPRPTPAKIGRSKSGNQLIICSFYDCWAAKTPLPQIQRTPIQRAGSIYFSDEKAGDLGPVWHRRKPQRQFVREMKNCQQNLTGLGLEATEVESQSAGLSDSSLPPRANFRHSRQTFSQTTGGFGKIWTSWRRSIRNIPCYVVQ